MGNRGGGMIIACGDPPPQNLLLHSPFHISVPTMDWTPRGQNSTNVKIHSHSLSPLFCT